MRWGLYLLLVLAACLVQYGPLACWPWAPDLPLALLAWALVDGSDDHLVERASLVGLLRDACDPGAAGFHLVTCTALGVAAVPARAWLFRRRLASWVVGALGASLLVGVADGLWGGWGDRPPLVLALRAVTTAAASTLCAWWCDALPGRLRPVGVAGA